MPKTKAAPQEGVVRASATAPATSRALGARQAGKRAAPVDSNPTDETPQTLLHLRHDQIVADPRNARKTFDAAALTELAQTIRDHGLIQPLVVDLAEREGAPGTEWRLVAGERRWRAIGELIADGVWPAERPIPCVVTGLDAEGRALAAVIENLQRVDLDHMEIGEAFERLGAEFHLSNKAIAEKIGRDPAYVQQHRRLTRLDDDDRDAVRSGDLTLHQALAIVAKPKPADLGPTVTLALIELAHAQETRPFPSGGTEIAADAADDGVFKQLVERRLAYDYGADYQTQRHGAWASREGRDIVLAAINASDEPAVDWTALMNAWRVKAGLPELADGSYSMPWLNGPFPLSPEAEKILAARKTERQEAAAEAKKTKARREATRVEVDGLTASLGVEPVFLARQRARDIAEKLSIALPVRLDKGRLVDAHGAAIASCNWRFGDNSQLADGLIAFALNFATWATDAPTERPGLAGDAFSQQLAAARALDDAAAFASDPDIEAELAGAAVIA